jgi:hypothetical protein
MLWFTTKVISEGMSTKKVTFIRLVTLNREVGVK